MEVTSSVTRVVTEFHRQVKITEVTICFNVNRLVHCYKSMTNREDEVLADIWQPIGLQTSAEYVCEQTDAQLNHHEDGNQISELWSENPPSSASSGFSDDDSLAGTEGDLKTIEQIVDMVRERGRQGLVQEYTEIRGRTPDGTFSNARYVKSTFLGRLSALKHWRIVKSMIMICCLLFTYRLRTNLAKNRYTDVLCFDHSRVVLSQEDEDSASDYINANFVDGYKQKNAYISTQGTAQFDIQSNANCCFSCTDFWVDLQGHYLKRHQIFGEWFGNNIVW